MNPDHKNPLEQPLIAEPGIGPQRAELLAKLGITSVGELFQHRPRRYEDRRQLTEIRDLKQGEAASVRATVLAAGVKRFGHGRKSVFEMIVSDDTARLHCRWWNLPFMERYFKIGDSLFIHGRVLSLRPRCMDHPETEMVEAGEEMIHTTRIVPIYPLTEGLSQRWLRRWIWDALERRPGPWGDPMEGLRFEDMPDLCTALRWIHFPSEPRQIESARQRLAYDEWIRLLLEIQKRRARLELRSMGADCSGDNHLIRPFLQNLGFQLTEDQATVLKQIRADMKKQVAMRRLLQGDVGSGKTVVAACSALMTIESGYNVAIMAPTEILAEQHHKLFTKWFEPLGISVNLHSSNSNRVEFSSSKVNGKQRPILSVGTHALIQEALELQNLGLVVIDEQHRFGVAQREALLRKGTCPHLLVMSATPIPRTLGLTLYGDLDLSIIRHRPAGRGRLRTFLRREPELEKVWDFVRSRLEAGERAFVVLPLVNESESIQARSVTREAKQLSLRLSPFKVEAMHGRLGAEAKSMVMERFRKGEVHVLVATTVIEVGVDVPEASIMVILDAERYGLAQLHQLRGRVGRGKAESYCILSTKSSDPEALARLGVLVRTNDGFELADADLKMRGPGEFLGRSQSGLPNFKFASFEDDLELARSARNKVLEHPELWKPGG